MITKQSKTIISNGQVQSKLRGQYFTPERIASKMVSMIDGSKQSLVLEPSAGKGVFLKELSKQGFVNTCAIEIDETLPNESNSEIIYGDFLKWHPKKKYDVIIGNPPYIRWKNLPQDVRADLKNNNMCNGLMDILHAFISHSLNILNHNGQMILITPDYWFKTLHTKTLRNQFLKHGHFQEVILYNEEKLFKNVISSIMIFKFIKNHDKEKMVITDINARKKYKHAQFDGESRWSIIPPNMRNKIGLIEKSCNTTLGNMVEIGNGMVSGLDKAFKLADTAKLTNKEKTKTIKVIKAFQLNKFSHDGHTKYILFDGSEKITNYPNLHKKLFPYKQDLNKRYDYMKGTKWFEWSFLRNYDLMKKNNEKIIVPCKERINKKQYVRFAYAKGNYFTTQDVTAITKKSNIRESIKYILGILNSDLTFEWIKTKGLMRGGVVEFSEKPLMDIPIKKINWSNQKEIALYDLIVHYSDQLITGKPKLHQLNNAVLKLYSI